MSKPISDGMPLDNIFQIKLKAESKNIPLEKEEQADLNKKIDSVIKHFSERIETPLNQFNHDTLGTEYKINENGIYKKVNGVWVELGPQESTGIKNAYLSRVHSATESLRKKKEIPEKGFELEFKVVSPVPDSNRIMDELCATVENLDEKMALFDSAVAKHEKKFLAELNKNESLAFQAHLICDTLFSIQDDIQPMKKGLQHVRDLNKMGKFDEAEDAFLLLMNKHYETYAAAMNRGNAILRQLFQQEKFGRAEIGEVFEIIFQEFKNKGMNEESLIKMFQIFPQQVGRFTDPTGQLFKKLLPDEERVVIRQTTEDFIKKTNTNLNEGIRKLETELKELEAMAPAVNHLDKVFTDEVLFYDSSWENIFDGWTSSELGTLNELNDEYSKEIELLHLSHMEVEHETNPALKRVLFNQLRNQAKKAIPRLNDLNKQMTKLGKKFDQLRLDVEFYKYEAEAELAKSIAELPQSLPEDLIKSLEKKFGKVPFPLTTDNIKAVFAELTPTQKKAYAEILGDKVFHDYAKLLAAENASEALAMFAKRNVFIGTFFEQVALKLDWNPVLFEKVFAKENLPFERRLVRYLEGQNLSEKEFRNFMKLHNEYAEAIEPVMLAKKELDMDPENITLRQNLRATYEKHALNIKVAEERINEWGKGGKVKRLNAAFEEFQKFLKDRVKVGKNAENLSSKLQVSVQCERTLRNMAKLPFIAKLKEWNEVIQDVANFDKNRTSWDPDYVKESTQNLMYPKAWKKIAKSEMFSSDNLEDVNGYFNEFNEEIAPIQILERNLEANLDNKKVAANLRSELNAKAERINTLKNDMSGLVNKLQRVLDGYLNWIKQKITELRQLKEDNEKLLLDVKGRVSDEFISGLKQLDKDIEELEKEREKIEDIRLKENFDEHIRFLRETSSAVGLKKIYQ